MGHESVDYHRRSTLSILANAVRGFRERRIPANGSGARISDGSTIEWSQEEGLCSTCF